MNQCTTSSTLEDISDLKYYPNDQCGNRKKVAICSKSSTLSDILTKYAWANNYQCVPSKCSWYLCQSYSYQSIQMRTKTKLYNHNYLYHGESFLVKDSSSDTNNISSKKKRKVDVEILSEKKFQ